MKPKKIQHFPLGLAGRGGKNSVLCLLLSWVRGQGWGEGNQVAEQGWGCCDRELREAAGLLQTRDTCLPATKPGSLETKSQREKESLNLAPLISGL